MELRISAELIFDKKVPTTSELIPGAIRINRAISSEIVGESSPDIKFFSCKNLIPFFGSALNISAASANYYFTFR